MASQSLRLTRKPPKESAWDLLVKRAKLLAWVGVGWHGIEAAVAIGAGLVAGSIALIGFGADSLIESVAGFVLLWRFAASRAFSEDAERRAQKLIGLSFYLIAAYVGFEAVRTLIAAEQPDTSWVGIGLSVVTLLTMPPLAIAKARIGDRLGSSATKSEGRQNMLCAYLSGALLVGLGANALFGLWWADPFTALLISGVAVKEGRESWRGQSCCVTPIPSMAPPAARTIAAGRGRSAPELRRCFARDLLAGYARWPRTQILDRGSVSLAGVERSSVAAVVPAWFRDGRLDRRRMIWQRLAPIWAVWHARARPKPPEKFIENRLREVPFSPIYGYVSSRYKRYRTPRRGRDHVPKCKEKGERRGP